MLKNILKCVVADIIQRGNIFFLNQPTEGEDVTPEV